MRLEHIAFQVSDPVATAAWYVKHLGMKIARKVEGGPRMHFLLDASGRSLIEVYNNPVAEVPDYASRHPILFHLAFETDSIEADRLRLIEAGAKPAGEIDTTPAGDRLCFVRDPWGVAVQLCQRKDRMP
ncbi:MAG: VOC family protein [Planctomycetota bacterium]|nr:VOC family protein [Planctomycetota bacterium]